MALVLNGSDSSATTPAVTGSTGGTGTGVYYPANNQVAISTNGTQALLANASQGVQIPNTLGVGATTPSTSGAGITFPATQSASTNANTLDDYEEGTWTPAGVLTTPGTSASSGVVATYTKIGRLVTVATNFVFTKGTGTGNFSVSGLPFTVNSALVYTAVALQSESVGLASNVVGAYANPSNTNIIFVVQPQSTSGASTCTDSALAANATIRFSVTYSSAS